MSKRAKPKLDKAVRGVKRGRGGIAIQGEPPKDTSNLKTWLEEVLQSLSLGEQTFKHNFMQLISAADRCCAYFDGMARTDEKEKSIWSDSDVIAPTTLPEAADVIGDQIKSLLRGTFAAQSRLARQLTELQNHIFGNAEDLSDLSDPHYASDFFDEKDSGIIPTKVAMSKLLDAAGAGAVDFEPGVGNDGRAINNS